MENSNIYFDIVPINEKYRGIERSLTGAELLDTIKKEKLKRKERRDIRYLNLILKTTANILNGGRYCQIVWNVKV